MTRGSEAVWTGNKGRALGVLLQRRWEKWNEVCNSDGLEANSTVYLALEGWNRK